MSTLSPRMIITGAVAGVLIALLTLTWATRGVMDQIPALTAKRNSSQDAVVDLRPWQSAQQLAAMAVTSEEIRYAREAERLGDHEVDQAFAGALREAGLERRKLTGAALAFSQKVAQMRQTLKEDQARVDDLTRAAKSSAAGPANTATDLDVAKAQLGLDSDELADAQQDFAREAGDKRVKIQQELAAHEAAMRKYDSESHDEGVVATVSAKRRGTLADRVGAYLDQTTRSQLVNEALQQAKAAEAALTAQHNSRQQQADHAPPPQPERSRGEQLVSLQQRSAERQLLAIYDDRIETEKQLAAVYGKWSDQLLLQHRILRHLILQSLAIIVAIVLGVVLLLGLTHRLIENPNLDRRRKHTLGIILRFGIQLIGLVLILFVIFGAPNQTPTILGLTTAGLTVVLQDFIIAFFGWFILMGKNGIRAGDWVEINGVGGEVVDVGIFRTSLLETGNWTDKGHPTGRRVTFINSFAIKGQFFNFSTIGQWMWDEITISIPAGVDSYATIERIREAVVKETDADSRLAEEEWRRATRQSSPGISHFTAGPAVDMRPGVSGIDVIVRYVTRASQRFDIKNRLYQRVIDLLHEPAKVEGTPTH